MFDHDKVKVLQILTASLHGGSDHQGEDVPHRGGEGARRHHSGV